MHHFGPNIAFQKRQHVITTNVEASGCGILGKSRVEFGGRYIAPLKMRPGVVIGVGGVNRPNRVQGEPLGGLKAVKGLKRAAEDHPTKIP